MKKLPLGKEFGKVSVEDLLRECIALPVVSQVKIMRGVHLPYREEYCRLEHSPAQFISYLTPRSGRKTEFEFHLSFAPFS